MTTKTLIRKLIEGFTNHHEDLAIEEDNPGQLSILTICYNEAEKGKILGRKGATFKALEIIAGLAGKQEGRKTKLLLAQDAIGTASFRNPYEATPKWAPGKSAEIEGLLFDTLDAIFPMDGDLSVQAVDVDNFTTLQSTVQDVERIVPIEALELALETIFDAIGKANGRHVFVDIKDDCAPVEELT